jgi:putative membrane protein
MKNDTSATFPLWRILCFGCGIILASMFWVTPLAHLGHHSLTGHMIEHLLLTTVAAPLILLGDPAFIRLAGKSNRIASLRNKLERQESLHPRIQSTAFLALCWIAGTATVVCWHIPSIFAFSMRSALGHGAEKATFFLGGFLFWWPVLRQGGSRPRTPHWSVIVYLFLATLPCDVLSAFLVFCGRVVYPIYALGSGSMESAALIDQERAGALMWTWVTFAYLIPAVLIAASRLSGSVNRFTPNKSAVEKT